MNEEEAQTKKERREAARQARIEEARRRAAAKRRKKLLLLLVGGILVAALIGVGVTTIGGGKSDEELKKATAAAGCDKIKEQADAGQQHIDDIDPKSRKEYTSKPPTSGPHFGRQPPVPDFYGEPTLRPEVYIHGLEHGQILVHYKDVPAADVKVLEDIQGNHVGSTTVMRNPEITKPVVITAWRYMQQCNKVSEVVIENFIEERCNKSPERLTLDC